MLKATILHSVIANCNLLNFICLPVNYKLSFICLGIHIPSSHAIQTSNSQSIELQTKNKQKKVNLPKTSHAFVTLFCDQWSVKRGNSRSFCQKSDFTGYDWSPTKVLIRYSAALIGLPGVDGAAPIGSDSTENRNSKEEGDGNLRSVLWGRRSEKGT